MITWIIVFALALLSIVVFVFALRSQQDAEALEDRLAGTIDEEAAAHPHQAGGIEPLPEWIQPAARFGLKLAGNDKSRETTALLLAQAGFARPGSLGVFLLLKTLLGLGIAAALFFGTQERSIGTIALMGAGYFAGGILPEWVLKSMAARRYTALERSMPDALDLMVICAEAGLPFTRIVKVVSRELELSAPVLAHELTLTNAELEIMPERSAALRNLAERTRVPSIEGMVSTLIQAEQFGTPLAQALHNIAAESRSTLILTLEERAGKLPARLSLPLMTLILPPVVAIVAAPALMRVIRSLLSCFLVSIMTTSAHSSCRGPQAAMKTAALFALWAAALMLSGVCLPRRRGVGQPDARAHHQGAHAFRSRNSAQEGP